VRDQQASPRSELAGSGPQSDKRESRRATFSTVARCTKRGGSSFSSKRLSGGGPRAISRQQAWQIVRAASERADVRVLALRGRRYGKAGEPAPVRPHHFRHARVRQIVRATKSLPIAQKQAG